MILKPYDKQSLAIQENLAQCNKPFREHEKQIFTMLNYRCLWQSQWVRESQREHNLYWGDKEMLKCKNTLRLGKN